MALGFAPFLPSPQARTDFTPDDSLFQAIQYMASPDLGVLQAAVRSLRFIQTAPSLGYCTIFRPGALTRQAHLQQTVTARIPEESPWSVTRSTERRLSVALVATALFSAFHCNRNWSLPTQLQMYCFPGRRISTTSACKPPPTLIRQPPGPLPLQHQLL